MAVRGASRSGSSSGLQVPLLVVGIVLLLLVMAAYLRVQYRRQRRQKYAPNSQRQPTTEKGLLEQIAVRKQNIQQFISNLRSQIDKNEQQLREQDELETLVTSRVATSHQDEEEWRKLMKAGKKLHGKKWTASSGDGPSLRRDNCRGAFRELMEMHKDELLEYKREMESGGAQRSNRQSSSRRITPRPSVELASSPNQSPVKPAKVAPPQWQSTRRLASSVRPIRLQQPSVIPVHADSEIDVAIDIEIPQLNFSKLRQASDQASTAPTDVSVPIRDLSNFEAKFHRQTRLARIFGRRKAQT